MAVINDIPLNLEWERVLRYQGIRSQAKAQPQIVALLRELLAVVDRLHLLQPAIVYELHPASEVRHDQLRLENHVVLSGPLITSVLASAKELAVLVCTIGASLEEKVADLFAQNNPLQATLLDSIGSAAVDTLIAEACQLVQREAASRNYNTSHHLSPGMQGWDVSEQWQLFQLIPAEKIGVCLTSTGMMIPRKSSSIVIGLGPRISSQPLIQHCNYCNLKEACRYKVHDSTKT
jgi:cobalamin-dependent methionine synthase I